MNARTTGSKEKATQTTIPLRHLSPPRRGAIPQHVDDGPASGRRSLRVLAAKLDLGHDFGRIRVHADAEAAASKRESCPLPSASPRSCPFGGACHTCPIRSQVAQATGLAGSRNASVSSRG